MYNRPASEGYAGSITRGFLLPDGIHTLAYGHKDVQQTLEADHDPPSFDGQVIPRKEATRLGLHWQRRWRCVLELRYDPAIQGEETEEDARAAIPQCAEEWPI